MNQNSGRIEGDEDHVLYRTTPLDLRRELDFMRRCVDSFETRYAASGPLFFFSTEDGEAWGLDLSEGLALKLAQEGSPLDVELVETETSWELAWSGRFELTDESLAIVDEHGDEFWYGEPVVKRVRQANEKRKKPSWGPTPKPRLKPDQP